MFNSTQKDANMVSKTIWRLPEVMARVGLSRSTIYDKMRRGEFPLCINLSVRAVGWIADEIIDWINERIEKSRPSVQS